MLDIIPSKKPSSTPVTVNLRSHAKTPPQPPVMAVDASAPSDFPSAIFGAIPAGFDLATADIHALTYWMRKAMALVDDLPAMDDPQANNDALAAAMDPVNRLFQTIKNAKLCIPSQIALQMIAITDFANWHYRSSEDEPSCESFEYLTVAEFQHLTRSLDEAVKYDQPTKHVGPLTKGNKLTRAGLLHRYHAFLIGELETLSWNLYGSRDYAMRMRPNDRAVSIRVSNRYSEDPNASRRKVYPFFDEAKLSARARAVLESLHIDTARDEDAAERRKGLADAP